MTGIAEPGSAMHVEADVRIAVVLSGPDQDAGVHADAHANGAAWWPYLCGERTLAHHGRHHRIDGTLEDDKETISPARDLVAVVLREGLPKHRLVSCHNHAVRIVPEATQQPRRSLDVS